MNIIKKIYYLNFLYIILYFSALPTMFAQSDKEFKYGLSVYKKGNCMGCHSWHGKGGHGAGVSLRVSKLNLDELIEVINCGRPGSGMPYFNRKAYKEEKCYDTSFDDYINNDYKPNSPKKFLNKRQILAVTYFIKENLQGKKLNKSYCESFFEKGSRVCEKL